MDQITPGAHAQQISGSVWKRIYKWRVFKVQEKILKPAVKDAGVLVWTGVSEDAWGTCGSICQETKAEPDHTTQLWPKTNH